MTQVSDLPIATAMPQHTSNSSLPQATAFNSTYPNNPTQLPHLTENSHMQPHLQPHLQPHFVTNYVGTETMSVAWRFSKTVKFFAAIDLFFCLLYGIKYPVFLIAAILPFLGYQGAKEYNICKARSYGIFVLLNMAVRIYVYTLQQGATNLFFCILSVFVECWILRILHRFTRVIRELDDGELEQIRVPHWQPIQTSLIWF